MNPGLEARSCGNAVLLNPPNNVTTMLRYFNNNNYYYFKNMPLLCYTAKYFYYIPPILVVWRCSISQTEAFATDTNLYIHYTSRIKM
jgi:hypothetical protein